MIETLVVIVHVFSCVALILIVLLQAGKGAEMGVSFGGGSSQALMGSSGETPVIGKITTAIAIIFMLTSLSLAYMSGHTKSESVMDKAVHTKTQTSNDPVKTDNSVNDSQSKDTTNDPAQKNEAVSTESAAPEKDASQPVPSGEAGTK